MLTDLYRHLIVFLLSATVYLVLCPIALGQSLTSSTEIYAPVRLPKELRQTYTKTRPLRVLCLDGGGVRGIIPARILAEIERKTNKPISELFDLIVGNSTGGIIALGLTVPNDKKQPKYTADAILHLYINNVQKIFEKSFVNLILSGWGLWGSQYDRNNLDEALEAIFGDMRFNQTLKPVLILSYLINTAQTHVWISKPGHKRPQDYLVRDIAGATSAAPTYFSPKRMVDSSGKTTYEADGGIYGNNPSTAAIAEIFRSLPDISRDSILLVSIGTGEVKFNKKLEELENTGLIGWVIDANLIDVRMNALNSLVEWQISILNHASKRIQIILPSSLGSLDDASYENIEALLHVTDEYITNNSKMLDEICRKLLRK